MSKRNAGFLLSALMLLGGSDMVHTGAALPRVLGTTPQPQTPPGPRPADPMGVTCPRCGALPGKGCDRRTLGRRRFHLARVQAADGATP